MKKKPKLIFVLAFALLTQLVQAQAYLYLDRKGEDTDHRWKQGEPIEILLLNGEEEIWRRGYFNGGDSTGIVLGTQFVPFERIAGVRYARGLMPFFSQASFTAAGLFSGIFATNALINNETPLLTNGQLYFGAGFVAAGFVLRLFGYHDRRMLKGYRFRIIDISKIPE